MKKRGLLTAMKEKHNFLSTNEKVMNALAKFASMKILVGIRDGLTMIIPFTVIGSIFMIIGYFPIPGWADKVASVQYFFDSAVAVTFGALGLLAAIGIGYHMAKQYEGIDPFTNSCMTVIAYLLATLGKDFTISVDNLSAEGMFTAILVAILVTQVHRLFLKKNTCLQVFQKH
jgi:PTS system cellobiose-specific IIC component